MIDIDDLAEIPNANVTVTRLAVDKATGGNPHPQCHGGRVQRRHRQRETSPAAKRESSKRLAWEGETPVENPPYQGC